MIITAISDTHNKHYLINKDLPGGDLLIHSGDISSIGKPYEIDKFCSWFNSQSNYVNKLFISGNHDFLFERDHKRSSTIVNSYTNIKYLQDTYVTVESEDRPIKVYGSPWQPEFYNWAFNLPKDGFELQAVWDAIPNDIDILITHGPPKSILDKVDGLDEELGCQLLYLKAKEIKPKIHIFGHIHSGRGYFFDGDTHYINAAVLGESYEYDYLPITFHWDPLLNTIDFIKI